MNSVGTTSQNFELVVETYNDPQKLDRMLSDIFMESIKSNTEWHRDSQRGTASVSPPCNSVIRIQKQRVFTRAKLRRIS